MPLRIKVGQRSICLPRVQDLSLCWEAGNGGRGLQSEWEVVACFRTTFDFNPSLQTNVSIQRSTLGSVPVSRDPASRPSLESMCTRQEDDVVEEGVDGAAWLVDGGDDGVVFLCQLLQRLHHLSDGAWG